MPSDLSVYIVDDDEPVRDSLRLLLEANGFEAKVYASAKEFVAAYEPGSGGCLVLDVRMPGMNGLELQQELTAERDILPVIIITGHGDFPLSFRAMKAGVFDFIEKPFAWKIILNAIKRALAVSKENLQHRVGKDENVTRTAPLWRRE